ncbi:N-formylglutamate amidohydrolase [Butyrivibrio sp. AC2005]|uniref:N-formylglutamate amidohydrolase n=1 Tax=Butyrivibrio sp. AC2005 TaxID=1280672 RepID=UPI000412394A|nr:N-formylglutamate amidohydrolase [Butyrivibrio sp. AC2005]
MRKKFPIVINVPHSSLLIPEGEMQFFERPRLIRELVAMTDHCCDDLFDTGHEMLVFPVSRLVCDFERFRDDADEIMSQKGMGAVYTRCSDMSLLRVIDVENKERILRTYYDRYHSYLERLVEMRLLRHGCCLIIDGHSFYESPLPYEKDQNKDRPDICIGTDAFHTPEILVEEVWDFFEKRGYSTAINAPFAGAIVPMKYYKSDERVKSIMIEINRRLYIGTDGTIKPEYQMIKNDINEAVHILERSVMS